MSADLHGMLDDAINGVVSRPDGIKAAVAVARRMHERIVELVGDGKPLAAQPPVKPRRIPAKSFVIPSKYPGACLECRAPIKVDDTVVWRRGVRGVKCFDCGKSEVSQ